MPQIGFNHGFLEGLSDFWTRFFADADQLDAMYRGSAILIGQAYLDMLSNVLSVSVQDCPALNKEFYHLVLVREDEVSFVRGFASDDDRWVYTLQDGLKTFISLDNRVVEPTASLQQNNDYDLDDTTIRFKVDPTDPLHDGNPLQTYARRLTDVLTGGAFDDTARGVLETWGSRGVFKGDTIRLLDLSMDVPPAQRKHSDHAIILVRDKALYVDVDTPLPSTGSPQNFVILRRPFDSLVEFESMTFIGSVATLAHSRLDQGSVRVFAKRLSDGQDVVENVDYNVDYEKGRVIKLTTWMVSSTNKVSYKWQQEVWPNAGLPPPPRFAQTGIVLATPLSGKTVPTRVYQLALWAPDARVDRGLLAANFGALIGVIEPSSEAYRAFLRGIFQLYVLGPVLERIESALNVVLGLPVIRDDGEVLQSVDTTLQDLNRVFTDKRFYDFPKSTPIRPDVLDSTNFGKLTFQSFEPLTIAVQVTDYIQDPTWWHHIVIPRELFAETGGATIPDNQRRSVNPNYVRNIVGAEDKPKFGDPGLKYGADEEGTIPPPGHPVFRRRLAFVLMDRFFKFHTFFVRFDPGVFADVNVARFARSFDDLQRLVITSKPAHTFALVEPATTLRDLVTIAEQGFFQPPNFVGADPDGPEIFPTAGDTVPGHPYVELGLFVGTSIISPPGNADQVIFADGPPQYGVNGWTSGDYFHYEMATNAINFPSTGVPVAIPGAPAPPRRRRFVEIYVAGDIGGKRLVENIDYTVDYANCTITRLTAWTSVAAVPVTYLQLNIGNVTDAPADVTVGDMPLLFGGPDPARPRAAYDPAAVDWLGNVIPVTDHRDISLVERALTIRIT